MSALSLVSPSEPPALGEVVPGIEVSPGGALASKGGLHSVRAGHPEFPIIIVQADVKICTTCAILIYLCVDGHPSWLTILP